MRIRDVVAAKNDQKVVTVGPDATVRDLLGLLAEHNVGALVVSADGESVVGIVSERDVVRRLHSDTDLMSATVETIMTGDVRTCSPGDELDDLMALMSQRRIRHVPVCDGDRLVGIVSIGDVVKHKIDALQFERDQLDSYVHQS
jgi:CBS domain-containing protein